MDFTLDDQQQAISDLADRILGERTGSDAWTALVDADLVQLCLPEEAGGSGLGILEASLVARQVGRHVAQVPFWSAVAASRAVARHAHVLLPTGTDHLAVAVWGTVSENEGSRLTGVLSPVPWARGARALLVAAPSGLFVVDTESPGAELVDEQVITGEPTCTVELEGVEGVALGGGRVARESLLQSIRLLIGGTMLGVCEEALAMTARHAKERQQFGSPIGTFQAVAHRSADAYIDTEAVRLTVLQAAWQLDAGWDATEAVATASFWACEAGHRVLHAAQHLHGGIGMDTDYPLHQYFRWATALESLLGGPHEALLRLGACLSAGELSVT
ncbi:MAG: acyl-CoA dehydrogenase family protein [Acidimicrobiales bacterium]